MSRNPSTSAAHAFKVTREDIEGLHYLRDPRKAALYLGIPQTQIEDVWAEIPPPRPRGYEPHERENSGANAYSSYRDNARSGSDRLKRELLQAMLRWAGKHDATIDEAAGFLLSGKVKANHFTEVKHAALSQSAVGEQRIVDARC